jgi:hypothetical protein
VPCQPRTQPAAARRAHREQHEELVLRARFADGEDSRTLLSELVRETREGVLLDAALPGRSGATWGAGSVESTGPPWSGSSLRWTRMSRARLS